MLTDQALTLGVAFGLLLLVAPGVPPHVAVVAGAGIALLLVMLVRAEQQIRSVLEWSRNVEPDPVEQHQQAYAAGEIDEAELEIRLEQALDSEVGE